jgi:hypothetical protein
MYISVEGAVLAQNQANLFRLTTLINLRGMIYITVDNQFYGGHPLSQISYISRMHVVYNTTIDFNSCHFCCICMSNH